MIDEEGYILKEVWSAKRIKIPDGYVKCSECQGTGKVIKIFRDPGPNEFMTCLTCMGIGYVCHSEACNKELEIPRKEELICDKSKEPPCHLEPSTELCKKCLLDTKENTTP